MINYTNTINRLGRIAYDRYTAGDNQYMPNEQYAIVAFIYGLTINDVELDVNAAFLAQFPQKS